MLRYAFLVAVLPILLSSLSDGGTRKDGVCPWYVRRGRFGCSSDQFQCLNGKCIPKQYYCDKGMDCSDNSDERFCSTADPCPIEPPFWKCRDWNRCIPLEFVADGQTHCHNGDDENFLGGIAVDDTLRNAIQWLEVAYKKPEPAAEVWGHQVDKLAVALHLANATTARIRKEMISEVSFRLLSRLIRCPLAEVPSNELASFVNALTVLCLDPRSFHGINIVQELRSRRNHAHPYVLLALCTAGESITESDKKNLVEIFSRKKRDFWTEMQAYAVMALACGRRQPGSDVDQETILKFTTELKHQQYRNGSLEDLQATALVLQALFAAEPDEDTLHFDEAAAMEQIRGAQNKNGSFNSLMDLYYILPVLNCKSMAHIGSEHCPRNVRREEDAVLQELMDLSGSMLRVQYSLWFGDRRGMEWYIALTVPANATFYRVMQMAAEIDSRYRFEYTVKDRKPYVTAIHGIRENVEMDKFWHLYTVKDGKPTPVAQSPADFVPGNNDNLVMWYRNGSWIE